MANEFVTLNGLHQFTYKGHFFSQTKSYSDTGSPLWRVEGRFTKDAGTRPLLTSKRACCEWLNHALLAE